MFNCCVQVSLCVQWCNLSGNYELQVEEGCAVCYANTICRTQTGTQAVAMCCISWITLHTQHKYRDTRKTQMTEAIVMCCISWMTLHRAHLGYNEWMQVLCFKSHVWILQFSDPSTGSSKRDLFLLKQWSFRSMECLAHKKFQIPSTCVVHTDTASGSPEHLQLIVLLEHTRTWYWPSSEGAPGSTQHFV